MSRPSGNHPWCSSDFSLAFHYGRTKELLGPSSTRHYDAENDEDWDTQLGDQPRLQGQSMRTHPMMRWMWVRHLSNHNQLRLRNLMQRLSTRTQDHMAPPKDASDSDSDSSSSDSDEEDEEDENDAETELAAIGGTDEDILDYTGYYEL
ncbi:hypothetical protein FB451DRAFT_1175426 [Mycena latifolia]|nr:hypothetical protein FB451DRAFT_1175426 [Mycena latifolia]